VHWRGTLVSNASTYDRSSPELLTTTIHISRNEKERVMIEGSINSVRISVKVKQVCFRFGHYNSTG
jgi:hypothetical protein